MARAATLRSVLLTVTGVPVLLASASPVHGALGFQEEPRRLGEHTCYGYDEEYSLCPDLEPCQKKVVVKNCEWEDWTDWYYQGGCSQIEYKQRGFKQENNEHGTPCTGEKSRTRERKKDECIKKQSDCRLSKWTEWAACVEAIAGEQRSRSRYIEVEPSFAGKGCNATLKESQPCAKEIKPIPCSFTEWHHWTECDAKCGQGMQRRSRYVNSEAQHGGAGCLGALEEHRKCPDLKPCPKEDCEFTDWSEWFPECRSLATQITRHRTIKQVAVGNGTQCHGNMKEVTSCPKRGPEACVVGKWSEWSNCTVECGGGQKTKSRRLLKAPVENGGCNTTILKVTEHCNTQSCATKDKNAEPGDWSEWSKCDNECGNGTKTRTRSVTDAIRYGMGFEGAVMENTVCFGDHGTNCGVVDCVWGDWYDWSGCTCDCGGGTKRRTRSIKTAPRHGGKPCEAKVSGQVKACNTQSCQKNCKDGLWEDWKDWGKCSSSCGSGFKVRHREIKQQPDQCGQALSGNSTEYEACKDLPACEEKQDCETGEWSEWSSCTCTCFGHKERHKVIEKVARGGGKPCLGGLREITPCNPRYGREPCPACGGVKKQDCVLSEWDDWSECSRTCGMGQHKRTRTVKKEATGGGKSCNNTLVTIEGCNDQPCGKAIVIDCEWTSWSSWSDCTKCGGQKFRHREVKTLPNALGKQCDPDTSAKEVTNCDSHCEEPLYCTWTEWSNLDTCDQGCGPGSESRSRSMGFSQKKPSNFFFVGSQGSHCSGLESVLDVCNRSSCTEVIDCKFSDWSDWGQCSCSGLRRRARSIERSNSHGGKPCSGDLEETTTCSVHCNKPVNCVLDKWTTWSDCASPHGQKFRSRGFQTPISNNGDACTGLLKETQACSPRQPEQMCQMHDWSRWAPCSVKCGGGTHTRTRAVVKTPSNGGAPCTGPLEMLEMCNTQPCKTHSQDCVFDKWEDWSACLHGQRTARRKIAQEAEDDGKACEGELEKTEACGEADVDCAVSRWTDWGACSVVCGGGQKNRERQIHAPSQGNGEACPIALKETTPCGERKCDFDHCEVNDWSDWSDCSAPCGAGQAIRERKVTDVRERGGLGCNESLKETKKCTSDKDCNLQDCEWGVWSHWSACTCSCDGGQMSRHRHISKSPKNGGKACAVNSREEVVPCNTQKCEKKRSECIDGEWGKWSRWSSCSAECGGGTKTRTRSMDTMANYCGKPAVGESHEVEFCNEDPCEEDVNCELSHWTSWSDCSDACDGIKRRSRQIKQYGRGNGLYCEGGMKETAPCNIPSETKGCEIKAVDCVMGVWQGWSDCPVECGGGQVYNERIIKVPSKEGGTPCNNTLKLVKPCNTHACEKPVDCKFGDWAQWGACSKCAGQRKRYRNVERHPSHGGKECDYAATAEITDCPRKCHEKTYCVWSDWQDWGECSRSCDIGRRARKRHLSLTQQKPEEPLVDQAAVKYEKVKRGIEIVDGQGRFQALAISFACGALTLVIGMLGMRAISSLRSSGAAHLDSYSPIAVVGAGHSRTPRVDAEQPLILDDAI